MTILLPALYVIAVWIGLNALLFGVLVLRARIQRLREERPRRHWPRLYVVHTT